MKRKNKVMMCKMISKSHATGIIVFKVDSI